MKCRKCGSENMGVSPNKKNPAATDLYCLDCGAWQKFATKDEIRLYRKESDSDAALSALRGPTREQVEKVFPGCDVCLNDGWNRCFVFPDRRDHTSVSIKEQALFCPICGKPLTDKAVDIIMERLEVLNDGESDRR